MKSFLLAMVALIAITFAAPMALNEFGFSSAEQQSAPNVRLD